jgi:hypothetical protein
MYLHYVLLRISLVLQHPSVHVHMVQAHTGHTRALSIHTHIMHVYIVHVPKPCLEHFTCELIVTCQCYRLLNQFCVD